MEALAPCMWLPPPWLGLSLPAGFEALLRDALDQAGSGLRRGGPDDAPAPGDEQDAWRQGWWHRHRTEHPSFERVFRILAVLGLSDDPDAAEALAEALPPHADAARADAIRIQAGMGKVFGRANLLDHDHRDAFALSGDRDPSWPLMLDLTGLVIDWQERGKPFMRSCGHAIMGAMTYPTFERFHEFLESENRWIEPDRWLVRLPVGFRPDPVRREDAALLKYAVFPAAQACGREVWLEEPEAPDWDVASLTDWLDHQPEAPAIRMHRRESIGRAHHTRVLEHLLAG